MAVGADDLQTMRHLEGRLSGLEKQAEGVEQERRFILQQMAEIRKRNPPGTFREPETSRRARQGRQGRQCESSPV